MDRIMKQRIALAITVLLIHASSFEVVAESVDVQTQLRELQREINEAQVANESVRLALDEARDIQTNDNWLNEERASSITAIVDDILADSDQRASLMGDSAMMGWDEGFYLSSPDGQFRLNVGGLMQTQFMSRWWGVNTNDQSSYDQWRDGFGVSRTQLNFDGHVFRKGITYHMEFGWSRNDPYNLTGDTSQLTPRMWDTWVAFQLNSEVSIKVGQFALPFTKEALVAAPYQMAVFSSLIEYRMGLEHSQGAQLEWEQDDSRFLFAISNGSPALFQAALWRATDPTPPWSALTSDTLYSFTMRYERKFLGEWDQFEQFTSPPGSERGVVIGIAGHRQNTELESPIPIGGFPDGIMWGITGDVTMQFDGASLFGSVIYERVLDFSRTVPRINFLSFVVQGSTYVTNQTELFARYESGGPDREVLGGDHLQVMTLGVNHYIDGQDVKLTADIGFSFGEISSTMSNTQAGWMPDLRRRNQLLLRTQLQLMF